jgi:predicted DNA-binding helix-hairpin-helix protein
MPRPPRTMEIEEKVAHLMREALDDQESGDKPRDILGPVNLQDLRTAVGKTRLFRILMTNACIFSCDYCPMRQGRKLRRIWVAPERLARVFLYAVKRGWAEGLFVTSGIPKSPVWAMDKMIELVSIVRERHGFTGYIHAKALPGAEPAQVARLAAMVDRMSFNLEAACESALHRIAPQKSLAGGLELLTAVAELRAEAADGATSGSLEPRASSIGRPIPPPHRASSVASHQARYQPLRSGMTTQFVVTPDGPDDRKLLQFTAGLYQKKLLHHAHYAAFRPIADTPMENGPETPVEREVRLYEADYLLRQYGFSAEELPYDGSGKLPLGIDVKLAWALSHPELFPVELLTADRERLLRVPGCGPRGVEKLLTCRRFSPPRDLKDLIRLGFATKRLVPFVTLRGKRLCASRLQLPLFAGAEITPVRHLYSVSPGTFR